MHPCEVLGHRPCLVALQGTDEVPFKPGSANSEGFFERFLHVVFAEGALPCRNRFAHAGSRPGLGHREQLHRLRRTPGGKAGGGNACTHGLQVGGD
jgi:hypothetical protein